MGFLDDFSKKASAAGKKAIAKTKDFADVARLNSNISDEEKKINTAYSEIGKQYFENHQNDFEECFAPQFSAIRESQEKIKELEQQIVDIKGVIKCPSCGAEVPKTAAFCAACGNAIAREAVDVTTEKKCPSCGQTIENGAAFCMNCGAKLEEN